VRKEGSFVRLLALCVMRGIVCINSVIVVLLVMFFYIYPAVRGLVSMRDPALEGPGIPRVAWRLHRNLTPRYAVWAQERVARGRAASLSTDDISGTEWPLFGSVFFLWGTENLQTAWQDGDRTATLEPKVFAREAIIAASELVIDPKHATWVQKHWGSNYLKREDVFYRMLVISALTSREKLLQDGTYRNLLQDQVEAFANELDTSAFGLLDDYPGECYPGDVMAAVAAIRRADAVLGTDHTAFVQRALRAFDGERLTRHGLPPYRADARKGRPLSESRGCGNSYICILAPELWPEKAHEWYRIHDDHFWQAKWSAVGFREFASDVPGSDWLLDVDAGPVLAGHGIAASAFGTGAARRNGRFDHAYPLATEMLATAWELPNGVLAGPRILSNVADAPMLGEAAILWLLTIQPAPGTELKHGGNISLFAYLILVPIPILGLWRGWQAICRFRTARKGIEPCVPLPTIQATLWLCLMLGAPLTLWLCPWWIGLSLLIIAVALPIRRRRTT